MSLRSRRGVGVLGVALLIGAALVWWLVLPRDKSTNTMIEAVGAAATSTDLIVIYLTGDPHCAPPGGIRVEETTDQIRLTARTITRGQWPFQQRVCPSIGILTRDTVPLSAPLGQRRVIDAYRNQVLPVQDPLTIGRPPS